MKALTLRTFIHTQRGNTFVRELPAKYIVCPRCSGTGRHVNPSIDGHGLSSDELAEPEFAEAYYSGDYDVECEECLGNRVRLVVDEDQLHPRMQERLAAMDADEARFQAEVRAERRMGC